MSMFISEEYFYILLPGMLPDTLFRVLRMFTECSNVFLEIYIRDSKGV